MRCEWLVLAVAVAMWADSASASSDALAFNNLVCMKNADYTNATLCTLCHYASTDPCDMTVCQGENVNVEGSANQSMCSFCKKMMAINSDYVVHNLQMYCNFCAMIEDLEDKALGIIYGHPVDVPVKICSSVCTIDACTYSPVIGGDFAKSFPCRSAVHGHCATMAHVDV